MFVYNLTLLFCKEDRFFSPSSTWTVQNSLRDVRILLAQACPLPLIDSTTGQYSSIGTHTCSVGLWLAFSPAYSKGEMECAFIALSSMSMHWHVYQK